MVQGDEKMFPVDQVASTLWSNSETSLWGQQ